MRSYLWAISALAFGLATAAAQAGPITFGYTGGVVDYTVPTDGRYAVKVSGAQGGSFPDDFRFGGGTGGLGATIGGSLYLHQGETVKVAVGGQGGTGDCHCNYEGGSAGGGGGSFLVLDNSGTYVPLAIAGGGGGAAYDDYSRGGAGQAGQLGGAAGCGATTTAGSGGAVSTCRPRGYPISAAGGGGGFSTSGTSYENAPGFVSPGGGSFLAGLAGGQGPNHTDGNGGFGGGGGSFGSAGGGGGGYTGGGGGGGYLEYFVPPGYLRSVNNEAGGGGGSFFTASGTQTIAISGDHGGSGSIEIARFDGANGSFAANAQSGNPAGTVTANVAWDTTADLSAYKLIGAPIPISGKFTVNGKVQFVAPYTNIWDMGSYTMLLEDDAGNVLFSTDFDTFDQRRLVYGGETTMFDFSQTIDILTSFNPAADFDFSMLPSLHATVVLHNVASLGYLGWSLNDLSISGQLQMGYIATDHIALPGEDEPGNVPEPAMLGLFGLGAIGLGLCRRRRAA